MNRSMRYIIAALILALLLSPLAAAALAEELPEELPELDLTEVLAPEEAPVNTDPAAEEVPAAEGGAVTEEVPAAEGESEAQELPAPEEAPAAEAVMAPAEADPDADVAARSPEGIEAGAVVEAPAADEAAAAAQPLALNASALTLGVGETYALQAIVPEGAEALWFEYATSDKKVATVSEFGEIKAKKKGSARITVKVSDGTSMTCSVRVLKAPKSIKLSAKNVTLGYDALTETITTCRLAATLPKGAGAVIRYASQNAAVAEVSADGLITPTGYGITSVTASTFNGKSASCMVAVLPGPDTIDFNDPAPVLCEGEKRALAIQVTPDKLAAPRFASSDPAVAAVDPETGELTAMAPGEASIVATSFNGKTASCTVTVLPGPDSIALPASSITMGLGEELALGATPMRADGQPTSPALRYASSKSKYVTISDDGVLTAKKKGTAKITVTASNGVKASCTVKVVKAPTSVRLSIGKGVLGFDAASGLAEQTKLSVTLSKGSSSTFIYSGYDTAVVSVAPDGAVTPVGVGATTIVVTTFNGLSASCDVKVLAPGDIPAHAVVNVAHRGGAGYWPENTLEAFRNAASTGVTAVELDVRTTKDGAQVVHYDATFTVGKKTYTIKKLKLAQLKKLLPDLCTLDEALEVISSCGLELVLELKDTADAKACVEAVRRNNMQDHTLYISFTSSLLSSVRKLEPSARLGLLFTNVPSNLSKLVSSLKLCGVFQKDAKLTLDNLQKWRQDGLLVGVWTVNDAASIRSWLGMGVDYILSDYPRLVTEALATK